MNKQTVEYYVNGAKSKLWDRLKGSKVFWLIVLFMCYQIQKWHAAYGTPDAIPLEELIDKLWYGIFGILIRAAVAKAELASNALNPDVMHVEAVARPAGGPPSITPVATILAIGIAGFALGGCADKSAKATARVCYTDQNGNQVCIGTVDPPPPPAPPIVQANDMAPAQGPQLTLKRQLEK